MNSYTYSRPTFLEYVRIVIAEKYADFTERATRSEYWYFILFTGILNFAIGVFSNLLFLGFFSSEIASFAISLIQIIVSLLLFVPSLAVTVRRLHDTGRSGINLLWNLLPIIGWIVLLVFYVQDSEPGRNKYGANPKAPSDVDDVIGHLQS